MSSTAKYLTTPCQLNQSVNLLAWRDGHPFIPLSMLTLQEDPIEDYTTLSEKVFSPKQHCSTHGLQCFWQSRKCLVDCGGFSRWNCPLFLLICSLTFRTLPFCHFSTDILSTKGPVPHWQNQSEVIYLGNREQIQPRTDWMIMEWEKEITSIADM